MIYIYIFIQSVDATVDGQCRHARGCDSHRCAIPHLTCGWGLPEESQGGTPGQKTASEMASEDGLGWFQMVNKGETMRIWVYNMRDIWALMVIRRMVAKSCSTWNIRGVYIPWFIGFQPSVWWCRSFRIHSRMGIWSYGGFQKQAYLQMMYRKL